MQILSSIILCGVIAFGWADKPPLRPVAADLGAYFGAQQKSAPMNAAVEISNFDFTPKTVTIKVGGNVTWTNKEGTHTVIADNKSFKSGNLTAGKTFTYTFAKPGTYRYYCSFHGEAGGHDMAGVVKVVK